MSLTTIFDTKDAVFFVGGRGTKAGDADAGGGCIATLWADLKSPSKSLSDIMGANGGPLSDASAWGGSQTACAVSDNGSGKARITKNGAFSNCIVGLVANVVSTGVVPDDVNDRFEVTAVDPSGNYVDCNFDVVSGGTCDIKAGGAFDKLQTAADETTAVSATLPHNVDILTNKAETFTGAGDQIDIDTGPGSPPDGTRKRFIGADDNGVELANGSYLTIDGGGFSCHVFNGGGDMAGVEFHHLDATNVTGLFKAGFYLYPSVSTSSGIMLYHCKSTLCNHAIKCPTSNARGVVVMGGYYSSDASEVLYFMNTYGVSIQGVVIVATANQECLYMNTYGACSVERNVIIGNGNIVCVGIYTASTFATLTVVDNVFYNVGHGIEINANNASFIHYNNIIVVADKTAGMAIKYTKGSILYNDYSCLWAIDGPPAAADRWGPYGIGDNSIEADPLFMDAANGDFRLQSTELFGSAADSPCLNIGRPTLDKV